MPDPLNAGGNEQTLPKKNPTYGYTQTSKKIKKNNTGYTSTSKKIKKTGTPKGASVNDFDDTVVENNSPTGYTPYKMLGHEHKGIKQRPAAVKLKAFGTNDSDMPDGISTTPGKYAGGVGASPAKGWFSNIGKAAKKIGGKLLDPLGLKNKAKKALGIGGDKGGGELESRVAALEAGSGAGGADAGAVVSGVGQPVEGGAPQGAPSAKPGALSGGMFAGGAGGQAQPGATEEEIDPLQGGMPYKKKKQK